MKVIKTLKKLQKRADEINLFNKEELRKFMKIMDELKETLREHDELIALSAPQIGYKYRIFCIKFAGGDIRGYANPMITKTKGYKFSRETQIGVNDTEYLVPRFEEVGAQFQNPLGQIDSNLFTGVTSVIFQQMMNIIDGILLKDIGLEILPGFDEASEEERQEIINLYFNNLSLQNDVLDLTIKSDKTLNAIDKTIDILTRRNLATVTPIEKEEKDGEKL